ncbi:hypothetical protein R80B4_02621 [Fibrobacteres bacterium R8-0-B4]
MIPLNTGCSIAIPAVAAKESWKPGAKRLCGEKKSQKNPARPSVWTMWFLRWSSTEAHRRVAMAVARKSEGMKPIRNR